MKSLPKATASASACVEELLAGVLVDGFVGDEDSAEGLFEDGAEAVGADVFAGGDEGDVCACRARVAT